MENFISTHKRLPKVHKVKHKKVQKPRKAKTKFAKGGIPKRNISLYEGAEELVGSTTWHLLDSFEKSDVVSELVSDGALAVTMANGGMMAHGGVMVAEVISNCCGVPPRNESDEMAEICSKCGEHCTYIISDEDLEHEEFADGGAVAEADMKVVSWIENGERKEKTLDKEKAELFYETMQDIEAEDLKMEDVKPAAAPAKPSLFAKAKKVEKPSAKKKEKPKVQINGIADDIARYEELKAIINNAKAEQEIIGGVLKEKGVENFLSLYEKEGRTPENFNLSDKDKEILFIVMDKYKKVEPEKIAILEQEQFSGLLETVTIYSFNPEVLERIGDTVSRIIMDSKLLSDEDKENLIIEESTTRIKKGSIDRLLDYENPSEAFTLIEPILALK